ncbi:MAG: DNA polymerase IV [Microgenomates bacterium OLB22]|nr:MAG: DNA polymerase IV [Microgenomates bacterium OLB22]
MNRPLIMHIDGDAFFASVEQALNPSYRGKPLVAGRERGIAAAVSYEAKKYGITRGMPIHEVRRLCPHCVVVSSDYMAYELFSRRMADMVRQYCPTVERYSIDEVFAYVPEYRDDIRIFIAQLHKEIMEKLSVSVTIGVARTKTLAKIATHLHKPGNWTVLETPEEVLFALRATPIQEVWGIGRKLSRRMRRFGLRDALDFVHAPRHLVQHLWSKVETQTYLELSGVSLYPVSDRPKEVTKSASTTRTFMPTFDRDQIHSQLLSNSERLLIKLYALGYVARTLTVFLKKQTRRVTAMTISLDRPIGTAFEALPFIEQAFDSLFQHGVLYRATGIYLTDFQNRGQEQSLLFNQGDRRREQELTEALIAIKQKYGAQIIHLGYQKKRRSIKNTNLIPVAGIKI